VGDGVVGGESVTRLRTLGAEMQTLVAEMQTLGSDMQTLGAEMQALCTGQDSTEEPRIGQNRLG